MALPGQEHARRGAGHGVYLDLERAAGFGEDAFVGRTLRIGSKAVLSAIELLA